MRRITFSTPLPSTAIRALIPLEKRIEVGEDDAVAFACSEPRPACDPQSCL